jgi:hypothetical protein
MGSEFGGTTRQGTKIAAGLSLGLVGISAGGSLLLAGEPFGFFEAAGIILNTNDVVSSFSSGFNSRDANYAREGAVWLGSQIKTENGGDLGASFGTIYDAGTTAISFRNSVSGFMKSINTKEAYRLINLVSATTDAISFVQSLNSTKENVPNPKQ